jgi:hypothetical protein
MAGIHSDAARITSACHDAVRTQIEVSSRSAATDSNTNDGISSLVTCCGAGL